MCLFHLPKTVKESFNVMFQIILRGNLYKHQGQRTSTRNDNSQRARNWLSRSKLRDRPEHSLFSTRSSTRYSMSKLVEGLLLRMLHATIKSWRCTRSITTSVSCLSNLSKMEEGTQAVQIEGTNVEKECCQ